ncbi:hypothetical protein [Sphingobium chungbukense]|uniref:Uncharacterized protein n=1 Tax=Sphingobium chungbukense TaxID=56193 RepID=A0A0M3AVJ9_9SPHN|nr:hypothetical protein [Sphingobium chungbukense]KKW93943.1 hypothetical protein YP76_04700 [Sphingobium chungbukense]
MKPDDDIRQEVRHWPGATVLFEMGGKHRRAIFKFNGKERFVTMPTSPGDTVHGPKNNIAIIRRTLKALGAIRAVRERMGRQRKRQRNPGVMQRMVVAGEPAPVMPDPWNPLRVIAVNCAAKCGEIQVPQNAAPVCECLSCASDMKGIYPCLLEEQQ